MSEDLKIEERVDFLESQNEALKRSGFLLVVLVLLMGATMIYQSRVSADGLTTGGLVLTNQGRSRSALLPMPNGHLGMMFYNFSGDLPPAQYEALPYLDGFAIYDRAGRPRIILGIDEEDNPIMAVTGTDGKTLFSATPRPQIPASETDAKPKAAIPQENPQPKSQP